MTLAKELLRLNCALTRVADGMRRHISLVRARLTTAAGQRPAAPGAASSAAAAGLLGAGTSRQAAVLAAAEAAAIKAVAKEAVAAAEAAAEEAEEAEEEAAEAAAAEAAAAEAAAKTNGNGGDGAAPMAVEEAGGGAKVVEQSSCSKAELSSKAGAALAQAEAREYLQAEARLAASAGMCEAALLLAEGALAECEERRRQLAERFLACVAAGLGALAQRAETLLSEAEAAGSRCDVMRAERTAFETLAAQAGEVAVQEMVRHERQQLRLFTSQGEACKSLLLDALRLEARQPSPPPLAPSSPPYPCAHPRRSQLALA